MSKPPDLILNDVLGANLSVTAVHRADVPAPHYVWIGEVSDQPFISFVALVIREDKVHGNFHVYDSSSRGKRYFLVRYATPEAQALCPEFNCQVVFVFMHKNSSCLGQHDGDPGKLMQWNVKSLSSGLSRAPLTAGLLYR